MLISTIEKTRIKVAKSTEAKRKSKFGQFFTPVQIAKFMAGMFDPASGKSCRLLDAGAGIGMLSASFLERCAAGELNFKKNRNRRIRNLFLNTPMRF